MWIEASCFIPAGYESQYSPEFDPYDDLASTTLDQLYHPYGRSIKAFWCAWCLANGLRKIVAQKYGVWIAPFWYQRWDRLKLDLMGGEWDTHGHYYYRLLHWLWDLEKNLRWGWTEILTGEVPDKTPPAVQRITWPWEKKAIRK